MKIDKNKYPVLEWIKTGKINRLAVVENGKFHKISQDIGIDYYKERSRILLKSDLKIKYLASSIIDHIGLAQDKLLKLSYDINSNSGVILIQTVSWMYTIKNEGNRLEFEFFIFHKNTIDCYVRFFENKSDSKATLSGYSFQEGNSDYKATLRVFMSIILFLQYAEIETKYLPAGKQIKDFNCLYQNESKFPIEIIDSTWFTTLVKSDAFKVRGHFRLQPYGPGMKERKLIWISDFVKEGYTREAKIMQSNPAL